MATKKITNDLSLVLSQQINPTTSDLETIADLILDGEPSFGYCNALYYAVGKGSPINLSDIRVKFKIPPLTFNRILQCFRDNHKHFSITNISPIVVTKKKGAK